MAESLASDLLPGRRLDCRGSFELSIPAEQAFPLFTALGEKQWVPGWQPDLIYPASGELEEDQVFFTGQGQERTFWYVAHLDADRFEVDYIRATVTSRVARVQVRLQPNDQGCSVEVTYRWTAITESGWAEIQKAADEYDDMMVEWKRLLEVWLARQAA